MVRSQALAAEVWLSASASCWRKHNWQLPRIAIEKALRPGLAPAGARLAAAKYDTRKTFQRLGFF